MLPQEFLDHTVVQPIQKLFILLANTCMSSSTQTVFLHTEGLASVLQLLKKVHYFTLHTPKHHKPSYVGVHI